MKVLDNAKLSSVAGGGLFHLGPGNILMPIRFWFKTEEDWQRFFEFGQYYETVGCVFEKSKL